MEIKFLEMAEKITKKHLIPEALGMVEHLEDLIIFLVSFIIQTMVILSAIIAVMAQAIAVVTLVVVGVLVGVVMMTIKFINGDL